MKKNLVILTLLQVICAPQSQLAMQYVQNTPNAAISSAQNQQSFSDEITFTHELDGKRHLYSAYHNDTWSGTIIWQGNDIRALEIAPESCKKGLGTHLFLCALAHIKHEGYNKAKWYAIKSAAYYIRFGARIRSISTIDSRSAHMYFNFEDHGDPCENLKQFKKSFINWKNI